MRKPYPFSTPVDLDADNVYIKVLVDMPVPMNLTVHLGNEHAISSERRWDENQVTHMKAHMYGHFRPGSEHYHDSGEVA